MLLRSHSNVQIFCVLSVHVWVVSHLPQFLPLVRVCVKFQVMEELISWPLPALLPLHPGGVLSFCPGIMVLRNYQPSRNALFLSVASHGIVPTVSLDLLQFLKSIASILLVLSLSFCASWHLGCFSIFNPCPPPLFPRGFRVGLPVAPACALFPGSMQRRADGNTQFHPVYLSVISLWFSGC